MEFSPFTTGDDSPSVITCFVLTMPRTDWFKQAVVGALSQMAYESNWWKVGLITPDEAEKLAAKMVEDLIVLDFNPFPAGKIEAFAGATVPDGWLACDGSSYATADYPELFDTIAYTYGGAGANFNVPDYRDRVIVGAGGTYALADTGGEAAHTLTTPELSSHDHTASGTSAVDTGHTHVESIAVPAVATLAPGVPFPYALPGAGLTGAGFANIVMTDPTISSTGGDMPHNNMQPFQAALVIIFAGR